MSVITSLLRELLKGRNLAEVARKPQNNHVKIWRIANSKEFADLRTGEAETLYEFLAEKPLIEEGAA